MKNALKILTVVLVIFGLPGVILLGQEKKNEKRIKIVTDDGNGKKVVMDTVLYGTNDGDSIRIRGGKVIVFDGPGVVVSTSSPENKKEVSVTVNTDTDENVKVETVKTITVINGDTVATPGEKGKTIVIHSSSEGSGEKGKMEYIVSENKSGEGSGKGSVYYITSDRNSDLKGDNAEIFIHKGNNDLAKDAEVRYVIARNGMVVTIEGDDDAKAKALFDEVQKKLDQLGTGSSQQGSGKESQSKDKKK